MRSRLFVGFVVYLLIFFALSCFNVVEKMYFVFMQFLWYNPGLLLHVYLSLGECAGKPKQTVERVELHIFYGLSICTICCRYYINL